MSIFSTQHDWSPSFQGKRVCVTGGAGFIGSHLVEALVHAGASVSVIDDLSNGHNENLSMVADSVHLVEGSILDTSALKEVVEEADMVFHLAAMASVPRSVKEPQKYVTTNAIGTLRVLDAARHAGVKRFIYAASSSAYGERDEQPLRETMNPQPCSPYAAAKLTGELMLRTFCHCYGMSGVSLRYFNIFGPRQRADSPYAAVIPRFVDALRAGKKPTIFGDGSQTRDFTFVANAVHANLLAASCDKSLAGEVINIACGQSYSVLDVLNRIAAHLGVSADYETAPLRPGETRHSRASIDVARDLLSYEPVISFEDGLARTIDSIVK